MSKILRALIIVALLLSACGGSELAPGTLPPEHIVEAVSTPQPGPTATDALPTTTPERPTATPASTPTIVPTAESRADGLSHDEAATLGSLERVDDYPLYTMRYYGDYDSRTSSLDGAGGPAWACSLFAALGDADMLYGRNFDWEFSPALLLFTDPPDGYASVSMVDIAYLGFGGSGAGAVMDLPLGERRALLDAPFLPFDGLNDQGLAVGMAAVPPGNMRPDPAKETVGSLMVIRHILDRARNVDEAVAILQSYNIDMEGGPPIHYLVADPSGRSVLVEFYQGEMVVIPNGTPWQQATNFLRSSVGAVAQGQCWRYDRINQALAEAEGRVSRPEAMDLLAEVSQPGTQWSVVYGLSTGQIDVTMGREYDNAHTFHLGLVPKGADYVPLFKPAECQFEVPEGREVECGYLMVPEDRGQPGGPGVRLHVAVFKSTSPDPAPDPVIHLYGGPGGNLLDASDFYMRAGGDKIRETRDYILFSQRGTHYAEPSLECPGQVEFRRELAEQPLNREERDAQEIEFLLDCRDDLLDRGINLAAYNSAENAADVNDLRLALGYQQVNLYGVSYGTRLALTIMRDYPEGIRSVILDSVFPPQVALDNELAPNADRAFTTLFEGCAAHASCKAQYPNLETTFFQVVDELNAQPATVMARGGTVAARVDGDVFMGFIFGSLYRADALPWIPVMIYEAHKGNYEPIQIPLDVTLDDTKFSSGMHYSVECWEEVPFESYEESLARAADLAPQVVDYYASPFAFTLCRSWQSGQADPVENEPVVSHIPTLVLAGEYDPITPPAWGLLTSETLSNSFYYEFPGIGHGVMRSNECGLGIGLQFLNDPTTEPDASCLDGLAGPDFQ